MNGTLLESHGQCHCFYVPHQSIISGSLELRWGKIVSWPQHPQAGKSRPWAIFFLLYGWQPECHGLLMGHPFDLEIAEALVLGAEKRLASSTNFEISGLSGRESGTLGSTTSSPRRMASSSDIGEVQCSSSVGFKREASTMSSLLRVIKGAMHFCSSCTESQRAPVGPPDPLAQVCRAWAKTRVFSYLTTQKSLGLEALLMGMKSFGWSLLSQGRAFHHPEVSCWVAGSLKADACHWA